jgi:hypothetical protein
LILAKKMKTPTARIQRINKDHLSVFRYRGTTYKAMKYVGSISKGRVKRIDLKKARLRPGVMCIRLAKYSEAI